MFPRLVKRIGVSCREAVGAKRQLGVADCIGVGNKAVVGGCEAAARIGKRLRLQINQSRSPAPKLLSQARGGLGDRACMYRNRLAAGCKAHCRNVTRGREPNRDLRDIDVEFFRNNLRQPERGALPHFMRRAQHRNLALRADPDPCRAIFQVRRGERRQDRREPASNQKSDSKTGGRVPGALEQSSPRNALFLRLDIAHGLPR